MENNGADLEKGKLHDIREEGKRDIHDKNIIVGRSAVDIKRNSNKSFKLLWESLESEVPVQIDSEWVNNCRYLWKTVTICRKIVVVEI